MTAIRITFERDEPCEPHGSTRPHSLFEYDRGAGVNRHVGDCYPFTRTEVVAIDPAAIRLMEPEAARAWLLKRLEAIDS